MNENIMLNDILVLNKKYKYSAPTELKFFRRIFSTNMTLLRSLQTLEIENYSFERLQLSQKKG